MRTTYFTILLLMLGIASTSASAQNSVDGALAKLQKLYEPKSNAERLAEAQQHAARKEAALGPDHDDTLHAQWSVADFLRRACRYQEAAALESRIHPRLLPRRAEGFMRQAGKVESLGGTATSELTEAGDVYVTLEKLGDARSAYNRAIAGLETYYREKGVKTPLNKSLQYSMARAGIAEIDRLEGQFADAERGFRLAIDAFGGDSSPYPVAWLESLGKVYLALNLRAEADAAAVRLATRRAEIDRVTGCTQ
jgi:hypothetical protein